VDAPAVSNETPELAASSELAAGAPTVTASLADVRALPLRRGLPPPAQPNAASHATILLWMVLSIGLVTGLAYWSEQREGSEALHDFAREQTTLALSVASALQQELAARPLDSGLPPQRLLAVARAIERPGTVRALLAVPGEPGLYSSAGERLRSETLERAAQSGAESVALSRSEARALGLPARTAMAGLHAVDSTLGRLSVIVVATAQAERDRQLRARWRLVLGLGVVSGVVLAFGGLAMRKQRKQLELAHALALSRLQTERDERLVRADKLATMGALASGIAHEVSTPLGVILGRAEQLMPKQLDERSRRAVETIAAQTERIHAVIRGFLALARGNQAPLQHCEPEALARAAVELVEHRFEKAKVALSLELAARLPKVACDPRLFEQVLVNLLLNACDACDPAGSVALSVRADAARVAFIVTDDGVGISPELAERATEPFFTTKPEGEGSGLGLAIANELVKHHGGTLTLESRADGAQRRGTRASVELPALPSTNHA
jgi:two-component system, NtrC family, sensor kinase